MPPLARTKILLGVASGLVALTVTLALAAFRGEATCKAGCGPAPVQVPAGSTFGAADPTVLVALFVDLESAASRQVFQQVTRSMHGLGLETPVALRLLQLPGAACTAGATEVTCVGARAVECAERLAGVGVRAAGAVFDLQWAGSSRRAPAAVLAAVAEVGVDEVALAGCVAGDRGIDQRLTEHAAMAARHGLRQAPGGVVVVAAEPTRSAGFGAWLTERTLTDIVRCLAHRRCEATS